MRRFWSAPVVLILSLALAAPAFARECSDVQLVVRLDADGILTVNDVVGDMDALQEAAERKDRACRNAGAFSTFLRSEAADASQVAAIRSLLSREVENLALIELGFNEPADDEADARPGKQR
ncbi:hypothetical protein [Maricaulis sp.]|uniref:hypothetical protein n=1 Tax=Maricaulis sp. TaxID=1486257 RepID=UPI003A954A59